MTTLEEKPEIPIGAVMKLLKTNTTQRPYYCIYPDPDKLFQLDQLFQDLADMSLVSLTNR